MKRSYFDVVVLGTDTGPLVAAALLARRGFRVLLLGQGDLSLSYRIGTFTLPRRQEHLLSTASPIMARVLEELNLRQQYRRYSEPHLPGFQVAMPGHRLDLHVDPGRLARELKREFAQLHRPLLDFIQNVQQQAERLDALLVGQLPLPPSTLLERHRFSRTLRHHGLTHTAAWPDPLADFPDDHPFRQIRFSPAAFAWGSPQRCYDQLAINRQYVNQHMRAVQLPSQVTGLRNLLLESIRSHNGVLMLDERADALLIERRRVCGVRLQASGDEMSAGYLAAGIAIDTLSSLLPQRSLLEPMLDRTGEPQHTGYRYTLNLVVKREGIPAALGRTVYWLCGPDSQPCPTEALRMKRFACDPHHDLLSFEALVPLEQLGADHSATLDLRTQVWSRVKELLPFVTEYTVVRDSPHDGLDPEINGDFGAGQELGRRGRHTLPRTYSYPRTTALSCAALPVRTSVKRLLLCGQQVLPGLGPEGELLAAYGACQWISKKEQSSEWTRRRHWAQLG